MAFNFPNTPSEGTLFTDATSGAQYRYTNGVWMQVSAAQIKLNQVRNRIVNGAMQHSQENGTSGSTLNGFYAADQWTHAYSSSAGAAGFIQSAASVTPNGSANRLRAITSIADTSIAAGEYWLIYQRIEGLRVADLQWGTANAKQIIVRFGFRGPAGQYSIQIGNAATSTRSYVAPFTISAGQANTDTVQTFIIPGDTTGTWATDTSIGLSFAVTLVSGSTFLGTTGWNAGQYFAVAGQFNGLGTVNNTFELFDVGIYKDADNTGAAPPWEAPDYAAELIACRRYFAAYTTQIILGGKAYAAGDTLWGSWIFPVRSRIVPSVGFPSSGSPVNVSSATVDAVSVEGFRLSVVAAASGSFYWPAFGGANVSARM